MTKTMSTPKRRHRIKSVLREAKRTINSRWRESVAVIVYFALDYAQDGAIDGSVLVAIAERLPVLL